MIPLDGIRRRARIATVYCDARSTVDESCEERSVSESGAVLDAMPMPSEEVLPVLYRRGGCGWRPAFGGERRGQRCSACVWSSEAPEPGRGSRCLPGAHPPRAVWQGAPHDQTA